MILITKRLGGVRQELKDLKRDVNSSLTEFNSPTATKFDGIKVALTTLNKIFRHTLTL